MAGNVVMVINSAAVSSPELPFGGVKHSGYGHELGRMGIQEFVNKKLIRSGQVAAPV
jgi:succinate-semialdehyde dehydrogenase/glutarate-semialdehyde dehydrogenase